MAQLYSFVDGNGETRLLAEIHPTPLPSQWSVSAAGDLVLAPADGDGSDSDVALQIKMPASANYGLDVYALFSDAHPFLRADYQRRLNIVGDSTPGQVILYQTGGSTVITLDSVVGLVLQLHAAPADGSLSGGDCALWFDQTNGAAKLMVKAKQADGTVRTGSLALT